MDNFCKECYYQFIKCMEEHNIPYNPNVISPVSTVTGYFNSLPDISPKVAYTFSEPVINTFPDNLNVNYDDDYQAPTNSYFPMMEDNSETSESDDIGDQTQIPSEISEPSELDTEEYEYHEENLRDLIEPTTEFSEFSEPSEPIDFQLPYKTRSGRVSSKGNRKSNAEIFKEISEMTTKEENDLKAEKKSNKRYKMNNISSVLDDISNPFNTDSMTNILNNLSEPGPSQPYNLNSLSDALPTTEKNSDSDETSDSDDDNK